MPTSNSTRHSSRLSISQASQMLGVSEVTLRQWTDEGKIKAFVTPGGHRRYNESDLRHFMGARYRIHGIRDLIANLEQTPAEELRIAQTHFPNTPWYEKLDQDAKNRLRELGRQMYTLVITYITKQNKRDETLQLSREVGSGFGGCLAEAGLSLTESMEAFFMHKEPLINAATDLMKKREPLNERAVGAIQLVTQITDEVLLSLVDTYQSSAKESRRTNQ